MVFNVFDIKASDHFPGRTENLDIYVTTDQEDDSEDRICHTIGTEGSAANINVNCTQAIIGRYVTLKRKQNSHQSNLMNICEVDVYGYLYDGKSRTGQG